MVHEAFKKAVIAYKYYQITQPEKNYNNEQARKRFDQDKNINTPILEKIIETIFEEQANLLKSQKNQLN